MKNFFFKLNFGERLDKRFKIVYLPLMYFIKYYFINNSLL